MNKKVIRKRGWNWEAFWKSFVWYYRKGMRGKGFFMAFIIFSTLLIGFLPVMIYCGVNGNRDFYNYIIKNSVIL